MFGGDAIGAIDRLAQEQCPNQLVIGQRNFSDVEASKCLDCILFIVQFIPDHAGVVEQRTFEPFKLLFTRGEPGFDRFYGLMQVIKSTFRAASSALGSSRKRGISGRVS